ncbi:hypothetical protein C2G38_2227801 [Gigaspora rosea]|uniref:Uncharacterized protein n=1 Tax=Gigaspora rosea TaxID=44941 RepID=A0A397TWP2_9GLOM|nr:hypothetical protein C2G38_2227801 [Gigaspora rosea]
MNNQIIEVNSHQNSNIQDSNEEVCGTLNIENEMSFGDDMHVSEVEERNANAKRQRMSKGPVFEKIIKRLNKMISAEEHNQITSAMEAQVEFLEFPDLPAFKSLIKNDEKQSFIAARNKLFTEVVSRTDDNSASAAIAALEQQMESGKAIINIAEMESSNHNSRKNREHRLRRAALCIRYLSLYIDMKILSKSGITITHLNSAGKVE